MRIVQIFAKLPLLLIVISGFLAVFATSSLHAASEVQNIRISNNKSDSRVVFDLSKEPKFRVFTLSKPNRVVIDLFDTALDVKLPNIDKKALIKSMRSGIHSGSNLRVVLDVKADVSTKTLMLKPQTQTGAKTDHRFVLDLKQKKSAKQKASPKTVKTAYSSKKLRDVIVAIDAGHGGKDPGALGYAGSKEKHVTLQISRVLAQAINKQKGMKAVLIRNGDYFIPLRDRLKKARQHKADLFLSIHADAFHDKSARGSSVYALSLNGATSEAAAWLARSSNSNAKLMGGVSLDDKDDLVASVLLNLSQTATIQSSLEVGDHILKGMGGFNRLHKGHVQQAGFVVLKSPDIPSVLIETAFLSNPKEEKKLRSKTHQQKIAKAITQGVKKYFIRKAPPDTYLANQYRNNKQQFSSLPQ